jgi:prevent-host-death family protein
MNNDHMKSVSVTEFKAHCLEFINQIAKTGQPMLLTKRGKPTVMVAPPPVETPRTWIPGQFRDKCEIVGDVIAPLDESWEALS